MCQFLVSLYLSASLYENHYIKIKTPHTWAAQSIFSVQVDTSFKQDEHID